jgi:hypothetical protein
MSYQRERDEFIATMAMAGVSTKEARRLLRWAATLDRLAVAQCNGDWPADNGERLVKPCPECELRWDPSTIKKGGCPDCRATAHARAALKGTGIVPVFSGDPRGNVVTLTIACFPTGEKPGHRYETRTIGIPVRAS